MFVSRTGYFKTAELAWPIVSSFAGTESSVEVCEKGDVTH